MQRIKIVATETIRYEWEFSLEELEEVAGITLDQCASLSDFIREVQENVTDEEVIDDLRENGGTLIEQEWTGEFVPPTREEVGYYSHDAIRQAEGKRHE